MDQASDNIIKMLIQGMFTGGVGPLDQSPDLPTLGFGAMRQSAGLPGQVPQESTQRKSIPPEQLIQEIIDERQSGLHAEGPMSLIEHPHNSLGLMEAMLKHAPMNWRGRRQSTNVEDYSGDKSLANVEELFDTLNKLTMHGVLPPGTDRLLFPERDTKVPQGTFGRKHYQPTPFAPTDAILEQIMMSSPGFWTPD